MTYQVTAPLLDACVLGILEKEDYYGYTLTQKVGGSVLKPVLLLFYMMKSDSVSLKDKAYIVGALGYFVLPIDIVPDFLAGLGYTDDLAVITLLIKYLKDNITPEIEMRVDAKIHDLMETKEEQEQEKEQPQV